MTAPVVGPGFGQPVFPGTMRDLVRSATPPGWSPDEQENLWYEWYDTQTITSAAIIGADFFQALPAANDRSLSNMKIGGQFPWPYGLRLYNITCDVVPVAADPLTVSGTPVGNLNDVYKIMLSSFARWTLTIDDKEYGPHSLSLLHGSGGPQGNGWAAGAEAANENFEFGINSLVPGWNYMGAVVIPTQTPFRFRVDGSATVGAITLTGNYRMKIGLHGIAQRGAR